MPAAPGGDSGEALKRVVREYWDARPCGAKVASAAPPSRRYFDEIEEHRYRVEPEIFSFAQFTRASGRRVLEVGVGAGTDFVQWVRAGAEAYGVDLSPRSVELVRARLAAYGLHAPEVRVADCEALPYPDGSFDLVYSWGVIHHTPDTERALVEIVRVLRPGGTGKVMVYHRRSAVALWLWARRALLAGRPWRSLSWCLARYMESAGTKAFTRREVGAMLARLPVERARVRTHVTHYDLLGHRRIPRALRPLVRATVACLGGHRAGWFMTLEFTKTAT